MNEREELPNGAPAMASAEVDEKVQPGEMEGTASDLSENPAGENQPADSNSFREADGAGTGEQTDDQAVRENSAADLPASVPFKEALESLRRELTDLKEAILLQKESLFQMDRDCKEFASLYPEIPLSQIPDSVWKDAEHGIPLSAAFACYERKKAMANAAATLSNAENAKRAAGGVRNEENHYFSPSEVRSMTSEQVRKNYARIMQSMSHWNK